MALAAVELRRFARDRTALLFVLVLPVAVIVVIGSSISAAPTSIAVGVVVADDADPALAGRVLDALASAGTVAAERFDDRPDLDVAVRTDAVSAGVVVDGGGVTTVVDQADQGAAAVRTALRGPLVRVGTVDAVAAALDLPPERVARAAADVAEVAVERVVVDEGAGEASSAFAYTAPSNLVLFTFLNSLAVGGVLVGARRSGITARWAVAPVPTWGLVGGVVASRLAFAVVQALIILVVGAGLFGVAWGDPLAVAVVVGLFALVATGTGLLAGVAARTEEQTTAVGVPLGIGLGMLGGCMWPLEIVGPTMRAVGHLTPHAWAMDAFVALVFDGAGLGGILTEVAVLAAFAVVVLGAGSALLRRRLV